MLPLIILFLINYSKLVSYALIKSKIPQPKIEAKITHFSGTTQNIIEVILDTFRAYGYQAQTIALYFQSKSIAQTAKSIFDFIRQNIKYVEDSNDHQKVKSPSRTIFDKYGDCKSYSILAASILQALKIPFVFRFVSYNQDITHVYVVAFDKNEEFIIDSCLPYFNLEKPYKYKKDMPTKISQINGIGLGPWDETTTTSGGSSGFDWTSIINKVLTLGSQYLPKPRYETLPQNLNNPNFFQNGFVNPYLLQQNQNQQGQNQGFDLNAILNNPLVWLGVGALIFKDDLKKLLK